MQIISHEHVEVRQVSGLPNETVVHRPSQGGMFRDEEVLHIDWMDGIYSIECMM